MKSSVLLVLLFLASPAFADDVIDCAPGSGMHFDGSVMKCDVYPAIRLQVTFPVPPAPPTPHCSPSTIPGTICIWPGVRVMPLKTPSGTTARLVALIEGPVLTPLAHGARRFALTFMVDERWIDCPNVFQWSGSVSFTEDVFCALP